MFKIKECFTVVFKFLYNPHLALCLLIAWMITNGWGYLFIVLGYCFNNTTLLTIGSSYIAFLWVPGTPEKVFTVTIALALQKKLFSNHEAKDAPLKERQPEKDIAVKNR